MGKYCAFPHILGSSSSYMTLQLLRSEFPYIWGKFNFLFYQCGYTFMPSFIGVLYFSTVHTYCTIILPDSNVQEVPFMIKLRILSFFHLQFVCLHEPSVWLLYYVAYARFYRVLIFCRSHYSSMSNLSSMSPTCLQERNSSYYSMFHHDPLTSLSSSYGRCVNYC